MVIISSDQLEKTRLPGRTLSKAIGLDGRSQSNSMSVGFARFSSEDGHAEPHCHAEEAVYIIETRNGWVQYGPTREGMGERRLLQPGLLLHIPEGEWHVFDFDEGGYVEILFFYAQVTNLRPEG